MSNSYCVATVLTLLPAQYLTEGHRQALSMCNIAVAESDPEYVYLYSENGEGPKDLEMNEGMPFEESWEEFLDITGLDACDDEPFVEMLREAMGSLRVDWLRLLQLVLREIPPEALAHIDVQGSYWSDKERPGEFDGFAYRVTRETVHVRESAEEFFRALDAKASPRPVEPTEAARAA